MLGASYLIPLDDATCLFDENWTTFHVISTGGFAPVLIVNTTSRSHEVGDGLGLVEGRDDGGELGRKLGFEDGGSEGIKLGDGLGMFDG